MRKNTVYQGAIGAIALALSLCACATVMSEDDCGTADWYRLGDLDGSRGETLQRYGDRAEACKKFDIRADQLSYDRGRAKGLARYCDPRNGFAAGRRGTPYKGVCLSDVEEAFLAEFELGAELYRRQAAYDEAIARYEEATHALDRHRRDLQNARNRYRDDNLSNEDREAARQDIDYHHREINALNDDLPLLSADIDRVGAALDDYRSFLTQQGRIL